MKLWLLSLLMLGSICLHVTVTVGQSVMCAIVIISLLGGPLHEWVVGEGASSLNHHQSHCHYCLNYSNPMVGHRL